MLDITCGGKLDVLPNVTPEKVGFMADLVSEANGGRTRGDYAKLQLRELFTTSDAMFAFAQLVNMRNLPEYSKAEGQWQKIAAVEPVDDFKAITFSNLTLNYDQLKAGKGTGGYAVSPRVAELDTYQYAFGYSTEEVQAQLEKRGFKVGLSLEMFLSDMSRKLRTLPSDMLGVAKDTEEFLVFDTLVKSSLGSSSIQGGVAPITGETVVANPTFSVPAMRRGLLEVSQRRDSDNRKIPLASGYYVVVPLGMAQIVEDELAMALSLARIVAGNLQFEPSSATTLGNLGRILGAIESEFVEDGWYLVPAAGTTVRPSLVTLRLIGRETPELLVQGNTGALLSGKVANTPFDLAHFDNDSIDLKLRQFGNAAMITQDQMTWRNRF